MGHSLFYPSTIGFITGVLIASTKKYDVIIPTFLLVTSLCNIFYFYYSHNHYVNKQLKTYSYYFIGVVFVFSVSVGLIRYQLFTRHSGDPLFHAHVDRVVLLHAIIISEGTHRDQGVRFIAELQGVKNVTRILLTDQLYSPLRYGDEIKLKGVLELPENFESDNGREFDYISFLAKDKIFYMMRYPEVEVIDHQKASRLKEILFSIKNAYIRNIDRAIPFPASRLASGITIAGKGALPKNIQEEFRVTGTLQAVVLSGYNTTIVAEAFMAICSFLPFVIASSIGVIGIILFTIMAGGSATVIRGSIMAILVIFSKLIRRRYSVTRALTIAALFMLVLNPMLLVFDPSFQLSFLATLGLVTVSPIVEKHTTWVTQRLGLRGMISSGVAAQLFVTPILLYTSGDLSIVALPTNMLLSLGIPITMFVCFITGMLGFLSTFLSVFIGYVSFVFLWSELTLVHIFSRIPYATVSINYFPLWLMILVYMSFSVIIYLFHKNNVKEKDM
ncbi:ComEC/Rec2 family competence protein [Patescibacteria group bacterium]|nr:ComEC/Rec2 family competence protein [Patescibacteria group bacterium]